MKKRKNQKRYSDQPAEWKEVFIIIGICREVIAAVLATEILACPVMAKKGSEQRLLNPPETVSKEQNESRLVPDHEAGQFFSVFKAEKPEGILKQVQKGNYTFQMPAVWEIPDNIESDSVIGMIQAAIGGLTDASGVAFLLLDSTEARNMEEKLQKFQQESEWTKNRVNIQYLQAPIGNTVKMTLHSQKNGVNIIQTAYYPLDHLQWMIFSVTMGRDSAPTAEETAAYMLYTLREKRIDFLW